MGASTTARARRGRTGDAAIVVGVMAYSAVLNRVLPKQLHVPANVLAAGSALAAAHAVGVPFSELGLAPERARAGLRAGALAALPIVAGAAGLAALPRTRALFTDDRVSGAAHPGFELAVRIPIGTALCEECIFRGALLGVFDRRTRRPVSTALASLVFGLWHVFPALDARGAGARPEGAAPALPAVAGTVVTTAAAGVAFTWLRRRSDSVVAPIVAHAALNAAGFLAVRLAPRRSASHPGP